MDDTLRHITHELAQAQRIVGGLTDERSRRVLRDYIRELETKVAQARRAEAAAA